jgi:hypothetical protein
MLTSAVPPKKCGAGCKSTQPLFTINLDLIMKKLIDKFTAIDSTGNEYMISCYQTFITTRPLSGETETLGGMKEFRCDSGPVNRIDDNTFQIVATQTEVKKVA